MHPRIISVTDDANVAALHARLTELYTGLGCSVSSQREEFQGQSNLFRRQFKEYLFARQDIYQNQHPNSGRLTYLPNAEESSLNKATTYSLTDETDKLIDRFIELSLISDPLDSESVFYDVTGNKPELGMQKSFPLFESFRSAASTIAEGQKIFTQNSRNAVDLKIDTTDCDFDEPAIESVIQYMEFADPAIVSVSTLNELDADRLSELISELKQKNNELRTAYWEYISRHPESL